jgi:hypothetical protein
MDPSKDAAKIRAFFIHPKFARQGLGSTLLKYCELQANLNGFTQLEMMATLPGVKLYSAMAYKAISDEIIRLPNKVPLRFVRMAKNLKELIPVDKVSGELLSNAPIVFFRKQDALSDQTRSLGMELRAKL